MSKKEEQVMLVEMPNGKHTTTGEGNRIYQAAFTKKEKRKGELMVFPGFICQGTFNTDDEQVLIDYGWELATRLDGGTTMWRHFNKESIRFTANALDLRIFFPKNSLLFVIK